MGAIGWKLDADQRRRLIERFPPHWPEVVADHVTLAADTPSDAPLPEEATAEIIGHGDDGNGVEAMVVRIGDSSDRPDGGTYHITWSLDRKRGRRAAESNDVHARGWTPVDPPVPVTLRPARL